MDLAAAAHVVANVQHALIVGAILAVLVQLVVVAVLLVLVDLVVVVYLVFGYITVILEKIFKR